MSLVNKTASEFKKDIEDDREMAIKEIAKKFFSPSTGQKLAEM